LIYILPDDDDASAIEICRSFHCLTLKFSVNIKIVSLSVNYYNLVITSAQNERRYVLKYKLYLSLKSAFSAVC